MSSFKHFVWSIRVWWRHLLGGRYMNLPNQAALVDMPYFSQFESPDKIACFFDGSLSAKDDPLWADSGATTKEDYAAWAWHMCGMACLKMALAHATGTVWPTVMLAKDCQEYGGYVWQDGHVDAKGLRYASFTIFIRQRFGWQGQSIAPMVLADIQHALAHQRYVIASVHPSIYQPASQPSSTGGHLILVTGYSRLTKTLTYNDPYGRPGCQSQVVISQDDFGRFFGQRGIIFNPTADVPAKPFPERL